MITSFDRCNEHMMITYVHTLREPCVSNEGKAAAKKRSGDRTSLRCPDHAGNAGKGRHNVILLVANLTAVLMVLLVLLVLLRLPLLMQRLLCVLVCCCCCWCCLCCLC